jgi:molybdopterin/thiamine biosynthesis adenylyltransferase
MGTVGMAGLGAEVAKNLVLAGVSKVDVHDGTTTSYADLSSSFLLQEADIGTRRDLRAADQLAPMNPYVRVRAVDGDFSQAADFAEYTAVIAVDRPMREQIALSNAARESGCRVICADSRGLFGRVFCDFGERFTVEDVDGEEPKQVPCHLIANCLLCRAAPLLKRTHLQLVSSTCHRRSSSMWTPRKMHSSRALQSSRTGCRMEISFASKM